MIVDVEYKEAQTGGTTPIPEHIEVKSWFYQKGDYSRLKRIMTTYGMLNQTCLFML